MAEKEIILKLKIQSDDAAKQIDALEKKLQKTDAELQKLAELKKTKAINDQFDAINKKVESGTLSMKQLSKVVSEYQTIAMQAGADSPVGQEAIKRAASLTDEIGDLKTQVKELSADGHNMNAALQLGSTVMAGYSAFQGVTALVGKENEDLTKTIMKLQAAQSVLMGIEQIRANLEAESAMMIKAKALQTKILTGATAAYNAVVGTSTGVMKAFKIALASTGIGAIIVGIGLLIANFDTLVGWVKDAVNWFASLGESFVRVAEWLGLVEDGTADLMAAERMAAEERAKASKALGEQTQKEINAIKQKRDARIKAADDQIKALELERETLEAQGKTSDQVTVKILEAELEKTKAVSEATDAMIKKYTEYYTNLAILRGQDEEEFKKALKGQGIDIEELQQQAAAAQEENTINIQHAENRITKFKREQGEKRAEEAKKIEEKILADRKKAMEDYLALENALTDLLISNMEEGAEKELATLAEKQERERQALIKAHGENAELLEQLDIKQLKELNDLYEKFEKEKNARLDELQDMRLANMKEGNDKELALLKDKHAKEREALIEKYGDDTELIKELEIKQQEELDEMQRKVDEAKAEERTEAINQKIAQAQALLDAMNAINDIINEIQDKRKEKIAQDRDDDLAALDAQKNRELATEGLSANEKIRIENRYAQQKYDVEVKAAKAADEIAKKQFNRTKALKIAEIAINTAASVMQALGGFPPPASFIFAGINATIGTVQAAFVAAQKFQGEATAIAPPNFQTPDVNVGGGDSGGGTSGGGGGGNSGGGSGGQNDITTNTDKFLNAKVVVSQVEINETQDQMAEVKQVATI